MRLGIFVGIAVLVLITLVSAFPQVIASSDLQTNTADHMTFTREIASAESKLDALQRQHEEMARRFGEMPEKMARIEERMDLLSRMVLASLGGILALLVKEVMALIRSVRNRRNGNDGDG